MAISATPDDSPPASSSPINSSERDLQPFFVLHRATPPQKASGPVKTRRKIDLSSLEEADLDEECKRLQIKTFDFVWSRIEATIKDVLRNINNNVFDEIHTWVRASFDTIKSRGIPSFAQATRSCPISTDAASRQLFTGLVFTKNMEFVDDLRTFEELGQHLKSQECHVANLSSIDFSSKNGIGGCLRCLLRQFLDVTMDAADISLLAAWYAEHGNYDNPLVVIVDDLERCNSSILSCFILMLSEWVLKIPVILIMGVATTLDALVNILPSNTLQQLCPCKFILGSPVERMDAIVEAVLVKQSTLFSVGYKVATFLKNYFSRQDGTLTSFIRALKIACVQHFYSEPLGILLKEILDVEDGQASWGDKHALLSEKMLKDAFYLPSNKRRTKAEPTGDNVSCGLSELKRLLKCWSSIVMCLHEAGKYQKIHLLDIYCEALDPGFCDHISLNIGISSSSGSFISQIVSKIRDLPLLSLCELVKNWLMLSEDIIEINDKVKELQSALGIDKSSNQSSMDISKKRTSKNQLSMGKDTKILNERAVKLMQWMVRDFMQPIELMPFHEILCFKGVDKLQAALIGDPRKTIQLDLLESYKVLGCSCCSKSGGLVSSSMHDTTIMWTLSQEHGGIINLHDWYQSFKAILCQPRTKVKSKPKYSPSPKKRKVTDQPQKVTEASIQARFCKAVTELQITGLLRMPSKRRPDYVQRVAFGI